MSEKVTRDIYGIKLKYPNRTCKECKYYPCFQGIETCVSDFAKYGCKSFLIKVK